MAWETGVASNHLDLVDRLIAFLSTNSELVAAGQAWEVLRNATHPHTFGWPGRIAFNSGTASYKAVAPDAWPNDVPSSNVMMRFTGKISLPKSGTYDFSIRASNQLEIRINGAVVAGVYAANMWNEFTAVASVALTAGVHDVEIHYVQLGSTAIAGLGWRKPGDTAFSIIPESAFSDMACHYGYANYANPSEADLAAAVFDREVILKGPGLAGQDEIYVGFRTSSSVQSDFYNIQWLTYATGFDPERPWYQQPGGFDSGPSALLWDQEIRYWFVASGRRFIVIAKVSTTYASLYGGLILPYGLPSEMPYPVAVGASYSTQGERWSSQSERHSSFWHPGAYSTWDASGLRLRRTDGAVEAFANITYSTSPNGWTYPGRYGVAYRASPSGDYALQPVTLYSSNGGGNVWGELDGVYHISGHGSASENTLSIAGKTYLVVQSAFRTTIDGYAAICLE